MVEVASLDAPDCAVEYRDCGLRQTAERGPAYLATRREVQPTKILTETHCLSDSRAAGCRS